MRSKDEELALYRLELSKETLANAKLCIDNGFYRDAVNRSYYAAFYAVRSVLAVESIDFKRHKDGVAYFNKNYVAVGTFPRELGKRLGRVQMMREDSDYSDFFMVSPEDAEKQYETAEMTISLVERCLREKGIYDSVQ